MKIAIIILTAVFAALASWLTDKFDKHISVKACVVGGIALVGGLCAYFYEAFDEKRNRPAIEVRRELGDDYLAINVIPDDKQGLKSVRLSFHLPVRVSHVQSENRVTNGKAEVVVVGGTDPGYLTNRIDIDIYEAVPGRSMSFLVKFQRVTEVSLDYVGKDLYELSYVWNYGGSDLQETEWRRIDSNEIASRPPAEIGVIRFVGDAKDFTLMATMKPVTPGQSSNLVSVIKVDEAYSHGVKGVDDAVQAPLPRRSY